MTVKYVLAAFVVALCFCIHSSAQTTAFTYQGSLRSSGTPASGNYDLEFKMYDAVSGGNQVGSTVQRLNVVVTNGIFTVSLDFGAAALPGPDRFLDIAVRTAGAGAFTPLTPRQQITSAPYAVKSLNASTADSVTSATGIPAGSASYIQNATSQQASSSFNIDGVGKANVLDATSHYRLNGSPILSVTSSNTLRVGYFAGFSDTGFNNAFLGHGAGFGNTNGSFNTFIGSNAGYSNTGNSNNTYVGYAAGQNSIGDTNSFFGSSAGAQNTTGSVNAFFGGGRANTTGSANTFIGVNSAYSNTTGSDNVFVGTDSGANNTAGQNVFIGRSSGVANTSASFNTFVGFESGLSTQTGYGNTFVGYRSGKASTNCCNAFFGSSAGSFNTTGTNNTFLGTDVGITNTTGSFNTLVGNNANVTSPNLTNATAIGYNAFVGASNSLVLGGFNVNVGVGVSNPQSRFHVIGGTSWFQGNTTPLPAAAGKGVAIGSDSTGGYVFSFDYNSFTAQNLLLNVPGGRVGVGTTTPDQTLSVNGGASKVSGGTWAVFSDERLKNIKGEYSLGLNAVMQLHPIRFEYKPDNALGLRGSGEYIGFSAQDVRRVIPEAVSANTNGYLQLNADPILWAMLNSIKEQQDLIGKQQALIEQLTKRVDELEKKPRPSSIRAIKAIRTKQRGIERIDAKRTS